MLRATPACTFSTSQRPKVIRQWCVLTLFTSKCFSRRTGVHFFHISTSKSGRNTGLSCTCSLLNVFRATRACTFSTSQRPKVSRTWCAFTHVTSKCASRHKGVQLFIFHLASRLRTRRFSEPTFRPSGATNHWKNEVFRDFLTFFAHLHLLSSDFLHLCSSPSLIFSFLTFSMAELLPGCASPSVHIIGSLTSKLSSMSVVMTYHTVSMCVIVLLIIYRVCSCMFFVCFSMLFWCWFSFVYFYSHDDYDIIICVPVWTIW